MLMFKCFALRNFSVIPDGENLIKVEKRQNEKFHKKIHKKQQYYPHQKCNSNFDTLTPLIPME